ncbi:gliding motility-associated C-terminal domain-containing protein [bacterium]|nr:gliding motility-associated C-terminal domain-containing protein [bacterium]
MKKINLFITFFLLLLFSLSNSETWENATRDDFSSGILTGVDIITPDPDGLDDGALMLGDSPININFLVVYPPDSRPARFCTIFNSYEHETLPPVHLKVYLLAVETYNSIRSIHDNVTLYSCDEGGAEVDLPISYFDGILFGVHDAYGYTDLSSRAVDLTRNFAALRNKVIIFTHSTVWNRGWGSGNSHPRFNELGDIHGLNTYPQADYDTFEVVRNVSPSPGDSIFHYPFELPDPMTVSWTHRRGQIPTDINNMLYAGIGFPDYEGIYFYANPITEYNSWGVFLNYGHTNDSPIEWDIKCTVNSLFLVSRSAELIGTYTSDIFDAGTEAGILSAEWSETTPPSTDVIVSLNASADGFTWDGWRIVPSGDIIPPVCGRYFQYKIEMIGNTVNHPILHWIRFEYTTEGPDAAIISPIPGSVTSCADQQIIVSLRDEYGIDHHSIVFTVNGIDYRLGSTTLTLLDSLLIFAPTVAFGHGDTVQVRFQDAANILGIPMRDTLSWSFIVDLAPPNIYDEYPPADSILSSPPETIYVHAYDDYTPVTADEAYFSVNGDVYTISHPAAGWDGDMFYLLTSEISTLMDSSELVLIEVVMLCDSPDYCDPSCIEPYSWRFIIDAVGPEISLLAPPESIYISCDSIDFLLQITDINGIDQSSIYIEYNGLMFHFPENMTFSSPILTFTPPVHLRDTTGATLTLVYVEDALGNARGPLSWYFNFDFEPPVIVGLYPEDLDIIGHPQPEIRVRILDSLAGVDPDCIVFTLDGTEYRVPDITWDGDEAMLSTRSLDLTFDDGDTVYLCVTACDRGEICPANIMEEYCWSFEVNLSGPETQLLEPTNASYTACDSQDLIMRIFDPNGVVESSILFEYMGELYRTSSPNLYYADTILVFHPSSRWSDGDMITFSVLEAEDSIGNALSMPERWYFIVDLEPPIFTNEGPPDGSVIATTQPFFEVEIHDSGAGLNPFLLWFVILGDTFRIGTPGIGWNGEVLSFETGLAGIEYSDIETLEICVHAEDAPQWCDPNMDTFCWSIIIDIWGPGAFIIQPFNGAYTACLRQTIDIGIIEASSLLETSVGIVLDGASIDLTDNRLELLNDTLRFTPDADWVHGDTVRIYFASAQDILGNDLRDTLTWEFYTDFEGPVAFEPLPVPGFNTLNWQETISVKIVDSLSGVDSSTITMDISGTQYAISDPATFWDGYEFVFKPYEIDLYFPEEETVFVSVQAGDSPDYCEPNLIQDGPFEWWFYVLDDDTLGPETWAYRPKYFPCDSAFYLYVAFFDSSGIHTTSDVSDTQIAYLSWDNDSDLFFSRHDVCMEFYSISGDTVWLRSMEKLPAQPVTHDFIFKCKVWDDDCDFRDGDRSSNESRVFNTLIVPRPEASIIEPLPNTSTSCTDQRIILTLNQSFVLETSNIRLAVDDSVYFVDSPLISMVDSFLIWTPPADFAFEEGWVNAALLGVVDTFGAPLAYPLEWRFYVDLSPPELVTLYPSHEAMIEASRFNITAEFSDYPSGIDARYFYLELSYNSGVSTFDTSNPGIICDVSDSITFQFHFSPRAASYPYSPGDSFYAAIRIGDSVDYCEPNVTLFEFFFWLEPEIHCTESTDPFTPNNDGANDRVILTYPRLYSKEGKLEIYDMNSREVFSKVVDPGDPKALFWNGMMNSGRKARAGVYVYTVKTGGKVICKGTVTLVR